MGFNHHTATRAFKRLTVYGALGGWVWLTLWLGLTIHNHVPWVKTYPLCSGGFGEPHRKEVKGELDPLFEGYYVISVGQIRKDTEGGGYFVPFWYWQDTDTALKDSYAAVRLTRDLIPKALRSKALSPSYEGGPEMPQPCAIYEMYALKNVEKPWLQ